MMSGFRNFVLRGNVVDLAVGVVMGAAFGDVVKKFTDGFLNPLIKLATGGNQIGGKIILGSGQDAVALDYGSFITSAVNLVVIAAVIYFLVVLPFNKLNEKLKLTPIAPAAEPSNQEKLLAEIRDALKARPV
jgi:large conductance mechanosensitive channel